MGRILKKGNWQVVKKVLFTASSGGHFEQLMMLKDLINEYDSVVLTEKTKYKVNAYDAKLYTVCQVNRKELLFIFKFVYIFIKTLYIIIKERPDVVISLGALSTIPACIIMKIMKKKVIFIESFAKIDSPTLTGKLVYKFADLFLVQWESMKKFYPNAQCKGGLY